MASCEKCMNLQTQAQKHTCMHSHTHTHRHSATAHALENHNSICVSWRTSDAIKNVRFMCDTQREAQNETESVGDSDDYAGMGGGGVREM